MLETLINKEKLCVNFYINETKRRKIELKAKYESDLNSMKDASEEKGRVEGIKENTKVVVQNMLNSNLSKELIMQITGVSNEYINNLMGTV